MGKIEKMTISSIDYNSKRCDIQYIQEDMVYVLVNLGFNGFLYRLHLPVLLEEDINDLLEKIDIKNKPSFLYHPLIIEEKNGFSYNGEISFKHYLLFLFEETTSFDIITETFDSLKEFEEIQTLEEYINKEHLVYIKKLMSCINKTYEETRLEQYKRKLREGGFLQDYNIKANNLKYYIDDFLKCKQCAKFAEMQKEYNVLKQNYYGTIRDYSFDNKLIFLKRINYTHLIYNPLKFDLSCFETNESEYSYEKNMSTLRRINKRTILGEIVPYKAEVLYVDDNGNNVLSQIECKFEIDNELLIPQFTIYEYAYDEKNVKFYKVRNLNKMEISPLLWSSSHNHHFILIMIMKLANVAKEHGLVMKKFKAYSYDYTLLFNVHSDTKTYLCQKPIRNRLKKKDSISAKQFFEDYRKTEKLNKELILKKKQVAELNKKHMKEWKEAKDDYEYEQMRIRRERDERRSSSSGHTGYRWSCWTPFFNESDYNSYLAGKEINRTYRIIEKYQSRR